MDAKLLIEQLRGQRKRWVEVAPGKRVQILLPTEMEVVRHFLKTVDGKTQLTADLEEVVRYTVGWEGFTEADLLGAGVGASDPAPFDPGLWELTASDHLDWHQTVARALLQGIVDRQVARDVDAKN